MENQQGPENLKNITSIPFYLLLILPRKGPIKLSLRELQQSQKTSDIEFTQGSKFKTDQYGKIRLQIFDIWCKNVRQMC